ncbi:MAG: Rrf2 family transcriptional regulator [Bacteroidota bacterium]|nr:Rrf2 family transcriptional regulator [Candidatus Kapabacteria bacterium]MCS7302411.1 Rrf2 family transcriptional regulator [Candidatus Kapabacteria bacterium]MCX7937115.1 Rrf2 family transcriptional regulator [Chlorobiota bacterium]MDW8074608.1 Rrf2 family transcriptional regulator [Bacteroidota bacterium]MDW8270916.1 Rrf2 family transcriptional regulator [Bacteroidota bacterium]
MLRLTKKIEYALFALQYMAARLGTVITSKEIADCCGLSVELTAKVLSSLARGGILRAVHGVHGGYILDRMPESISLAEVVRTVEGHTVRLVQCEEEGSEPCYVEPRCTIRSPLVMLQSEIERIFEQMTVAHLLDSPLVQLELPDGS